MNLPAASYRVSNVLCKTLFSQKGIIASINVLNTVISPEVRSVSSLTDDLSINAYINISMHIELTSGISNENLQFTTTLFTGYQALYDVPNTLWHIHRINENLEVIEPILGAQFYLNSVLTPAVTSYNGYYEIGPDSVTEIRLPNGVYLFN